MDRNDPFIQISSVPKDLGAQENENTATAVPVLWQLTPTRRPQYCVPENSKLQPAGGNCSPSKSSRTNHLTPARFAGCWAVGGPVGVTGCACRTAAKAAAMARVNDIRTLAPFMRLALADGRMYAGIRHPSALKVRSCSPGKLMRIQHSLAVFQHIRWDPDLSGSYLSHLPRDRPAWPGSRCGLQRGFWRGKSRTSSCTSGKNRRDC